MIEIKPLGIIHTPFKEVTDGVPIQGARHPEGEGRVEVFTEYAEGLMDLEGFSHIYLLYHFNRCEDVFLMARPYADDCEHGIFAIRSPHRPNHIGVTVVELVSVKGNILTVKGVDMLDGTPLVDIKPYNPAFDAPRDVRVGWMEKPSEAKGFSKKVHSTESWRHEAGYEDERGNNE